MLSRPAINTLRGVIFRVAKGGGIQTLEEIHELSLALRGLEIEEKILDDLGKNSVGDKKE